MYRGIKKALTIAGTALGIWFSVQILLPLSFPFLLGGALALAAEPMTAFLCNRLKLRRGPAAGIGVTAAFCLILLLIVLLGALIFRELGNLMEVLPNLEQAAAEGLSSLSDWAVTLAARLPLSIRDLISGGVTDLFSGSSRLLEEGFRYALTLTGGILSRVPNGALIFGTAIISSYMISARLPKIRHWFREKVDRERTRNFMGITWVILTLGFVLLRIPYAPLWAAAVSLVDAFPILGTGTVLLPWALVYVLQGDSPRAAGLLGIYALISLVRSVMEPKLLGDHMGLDPLLTLGALYAGYRLWGFGGMILAPVLSVAAVQILRGPGRER